jgi:hypothetical protein
VEEDQDADVEPNVDIDSPRIGVALALLPTIAPEQVPRFRQHIPEEWIAEALTATGTATLRRRRLPAEQVIWLVLGMGLMRDRSILDLVDKLDLALPVATRRGLASSAVTQARVRVGDEALQWLFLRCAAQWAHASADAHRWRGLALYGVDGTSLRTPDSDENREYFGDQSGRKNSLSGYPLVRLVVLMALRSHVLADASFGPYDSEHVYAAQLWSSVPNESLTIVDRGFLAATILLSLAMQGSNRHWLTRATKSSKWRVVARLGLRDDLVEMDVSAQARAKDPSLPKTWQMRAIQYHRRGFRPQTLLTSLVNAEAYPRDEIVALYHERWELEVGYDELKTDMLARQETIRSKSPRTVAQEVWGLLLAYNLVRIEMERIAEDAGVEPTRLSFVTALRYIRDEWFWLEGTRTPGAIPRHLADMRVNIRRFVLPTRRTRSYPRAVKLKMSNYDRKRPPSDGSAK